jgi:hypothetical protein
MKPFSVSEIAAQQKAMTEDQSDVNKHARIESVGQALWRSFKGTLVVFLLVSLLTALICYLGDWRTLSDFGNDLIYAGLLFVVIEWYLFKGNTVLVRDQLNPYNPMNDPMSGTPSSRTRQHWLEYMDGINTTALIGFLAALCIGSGWLIVSLVGG